MFLSSITLIQAHEYGSSHATGNFYSSLLPRTTAVASPSNLFSHSESFEQNHNNNNRSNNGTPIPSTSSNGQVVNNCNASLLSCTGDGPNVESKTRIGGHGIFKPIAKTALTSKVNSKSSHNNSHRRSPGDSIASGGGDKDDQEECTSRERTISPSDSSTHSNSPSPDDLRSVSTSATSTTSTATTTTTALPVPPFPASHLLEFYSQYFNGSFKAADSLHSLAAARETGL